MKINTKIRYALRTIIEIAMQKNDSGILQKEIAEKQNISVKYLDQIIAGLKTAGVIINSGGKKSGYILAKNASGINVYEVYRAFEPDLSVINCNAEYGACIKENYCAAQEYWHGLNEIIINYFMHTSIQELTEKQKKILEKGQPSMYYI